MNQSQFKDPAGYLCLAGAVVASRSPTQEATGSSETDSFLHVVVKIKFALLHLGRYLCSESMAVVNT